MLEIDLDDATQPGLDHLVVQPRLGAGVRQLAALGGLPGILRVELDHALLGARQQRVHAHLALLRLLVRARRIVCPNQALDRRLLGPGRRPGHFTDHLSGGGHAQRLYLGQHLDEFRVAPARYGHDVFQWPTCDLQGVQHGQVVHAEQPAVSHQDAALAADHLVARC